MLSFYLEIMIHSIQYTETVIVIHVYIFYRFENILSVRSAKYILTVTIYCYVYEIQAMCFKIIASMIWDKVS